MFITNQRASCPNSLGIDGCSVEEEDEFKLLGITIDRNLSSIISIIAVLLMFISTWLL